MAGTGFAFSNPSPSSPFLSAFGFTNSISSSSVPSFGFGSNMRRPPSPRPPLLASVLPPPHPRSALLHSAVPHLRPPVYLNPPRLSDPGRLCDQPIRSSHSGAAPTTCLFRFSSSEAAANSSPRHIWNPSPVSASLFGSGAPTPSLFSATSAASTVGGTTTNMLGSGSSPTANLFGSSSSPGLFGSSTTGSKQLLRVPLHHHLALAWLCSYAGLLGSSIPQAAAATAGTTPGLFGSSTPGLFGFSSSYGMSSAALLFGTSASPTSGSTPSAPSGAGFSISNASTTSASGVPGFSIPRTSTSSTPAFSLSTAASSTTSSDFSFP